MRLQDVAHPGDIVLVYPKEGQWLGKMIRKFTFGVVTHAFIVVDKKTIFETDGNMLTAKFQPIEKYAGRHLVIIASKSLMNREHDIKVACNKYNGSPYSYWDIATNAVFSFLAAPLRKKVVGFLGTKKFMLCSELVARIAYEVGHREEMRDYEGLNPEDLRDIALMYPDEYDYLDFQATE